MYIFHICLCQVKHLGCQAKNAQQTTGRAKKTSFIKHVSELPNNLSRQMQAPFIAKPNKFQSVTARKPLKIQRKLNIVSNFTVYAKGHTKFSENMHREV
jgi:hypothetical protein